MRCPVSPGATLLLLLILTLTGSAVAGGGPPMLADDPGTPGDGRWEINLAALVNHSAVQTVRQLPLVDLN